MRKALGWNGIVVGGRRVVLVVIAPEPSMRHRPPH